MGDNCSTILAGWLGGWVAGWLGGWVAGWLGGWVAGWLGGAATCHSCLSKRQPPPMAYGLGLPPQVAKRASDAPTAGSGRIGSGRIGAGQNRRGSESARVRIGAGQNRRGSESARVRIGAGQNRRGSESVPGRIGAWKQATATTGWRRNASATRFAPVVADDADQSRLQCNASDHRAVRGEAPERSLEHCCATRRRPPQLRLRGG